MHPYLISQRKVSAQGLVFHNNTIYQAHGYLRKEVTALFAQVLIQTIRQRIASTGIAPMKQLWLSYRHELFRALNRCIHLMPAMRTNVMHSAHFLFSRLQIIRFSSYRLQIVCDSCKTSICLESTTESEFQ